MATVTETYIIYINKTAPAWPTSATSRLNSWISSGKMVSNTKTEVDSDNPSKKKYEITRVYRSDNDREDFVTECNQDFTLLTYLSENEYSITNLVIT